MLRSEYSKVLKWLFATDDEREFTTMEGLADSLNITPPSVYRWRTRYHLDEMAMEVIRQRALEDLMDIVRVLSKKAKAGSSEHAKLLLNFVERCEFQEEPEEKEESETS